MGTLWLRNKCSCRCVSHGCNCCPSRVSGTEEFIGMGTTFKAAKQDCATKALADSKLPKPPERKTLKARPVGITATQELHELATKKGLEAKFKFLEPYNFEFKASMRLWSK